MEERCKKLTILHSNDLHGDFMSEKVDENRLCFCTLPLAVAPVRFRVLLNCFYLFSFALILRFLSAAIIANYTSCFIQTRNRRKTSWYL